MKTKYKLTPVQFAYALERGLGRALLYVREYGDDGIEEVIKEAVLHCHVYDVQIEGLRTFWLSQILVHTRRIDVYADHLLRNFCQGPLQQNDFAQQFGLASFFFDLGWYEFREVVFNNFHRIAFCQRMSEAGSALVEVAGIEGLEFVARTIFRQPDSIDSWECGLVFERACNLGNRSTIEEHLAKLAQGNPDIRIFWDACQKFESEKKVSPLPRPPREPKSLDDLLVSLEESEKRLALQDFKLFGRTATPDELLRVRHLLRNASDERHRLAFLKCFDSVPLPDVSSDVISLLDDASNRVKRATAQALSNCSEAREIALQLLGSDVSDRISIAAHVLQKSYRAEDAAALHAAVNLLRNGDHIHRFGMAIQEICELGGGSELQSTILWLYENGSDSFCRKAFLEQLVEWQDCPSEILFEAQWDSSCDIQNFARENWKAGSVDLGRAIPTDSPH